MQTEVAEMEDVTRILKSIKLIMFEIPQRRQNYIFNDDRNDLRFFSTTAATTTTTYWSFLFAVSSSLIFVYIVNLFVYFFLAFRLFKSSHIMSSATFLSIFSSYLSAMILMWRWCWWLWFHLCFFEYSISHFVGDRISRLYWIQQQKERQSAAATQKGEGNRSLWRHIRNAWVYAHSAYNKIEWYFMIGRALWAQMRKNIPIFSCFVHLYRCCCCFFSRYLHPFDTDNLLQTLCVHFRLIFNFKTKYAAKRVV